MVEKFKKGGQAFSLSLGGERLILRQAVYFALSLGFACAVLFETASPFACAWAAVCDYTLTPSVLLGGCLGGFLRLSGVSAVQKTAALAVVCFVNTLLSKASFVRQTALVRGVNASLSLLLTSVAVMAAQGFSLDGVMIGVCEALLGGGSAYLFCGAAEAFPAIREHRTLSDGARIGLLFFGCALLSSVEFLSVAGISFARFIASSLVMASAQIGGIGCAAVCGCTLGFSLGVFDEVPLLGGAYTFGALFGSLTKSENRLPKAFGFFLASGIFLLLGDGGQPQIVPILLENALASILFLLLPESVWKRVKETIRIGSDLPQAEAMKHLLLMRVGHVKKAMGEVSMAMERITDEIGRYEETEKLNEKGALVCDQFRHMAGVLDDVVLRLEEDITFDTAAAQRVEDALLSFGITPKQVVCTRTDGKGRVEINAEKMKGGVSRAALLGELEKACGYRLNSPTVTEREDGTSLLFDERPALNLRIGHAQHICDASGLCGDRFERFADREGRQVVLVSDGMGTGARAAIDGAVASWLFARLLVAGLNTDSAFRLTNSALIAKSAEETLATVDAVRFDLHAKQAEFFKAGANFSLIRHGRRVAVVGKSSMPLGILRETQVDETKVPISAGDIVLVMSDGVGTECLEQVKSELVRYRKKDPSALAERVVKIAKDSSPQAHCDDITVVAVILG
ncbi:MAG TPA: hypothetical protein DDY98_09505 [Ruminococcaceae bacterium]|nr:hypothetical protein [Oscillospiraceae bacterium]